jgi:hypothetical protein
MTAAMNEPPSLKCVRVGLPLVGFGVPLLWCLFFWTGVGLMADPVTFVTGWPWVVVTVAGTALLLLQIAGQLLCLATPREWHIRRSVILALALNLLHLGLFLSFFLFHWPPLSGCALWLLRLLVPAIHLGFITNFAQRIDQGELAERAETLIMFLLILLVFPVIVPLFFFLVRDLMWLLLPILFGLATVVDLVVLFGFVNLHLALYHGIPRHLATFEETRKLEEMGWPSEDPWKV